MYTGPNADALNEVPTFVDYGELFTGLGPPDHLDIVVADRPPPIAFDDERDEEKHDGVLSTRKTPSCLSNKDLRVSRFWAKIAILRA